LAVLDGAGRLQIPREYLEEFGIRRRVLIETTSDGILIRRPNGEHHGVEHGPSSESPEPAEREPFHASSRWSNLWQGVKSRLGRGVRK
ncbi:MAG TPA: hypothetical protein VJ785_10820, partial [Anaerolineales bacterium]|nr:hypothetical protein [Anaerolineales bacterium]